MKTYKRIIVHNGVFHADDVMCVAMAKYINPDIEVIRTRDENILNKYKDDKETLICDVGFGELDHHQKEVKTYPDGRKYASCALLYEKLLNEGLFKSCPAFTCGFENISHFDNGQLYEKEKSNPHTISKLARVMNPNWDEPDLDIEEQFNKTVNHAVKWITGMYKSVIDKTDEFYSYHAEYEREKETTARWRIQQESIEKANKILNDKIFDDKTADRGYLILEQGMPIDRLSKSQIIWTIIPDDKNNRWIVRAVPEIPNDFKVKVPLLDEWKEDPQFNFVHENKHFASFPYNGSKEESLVKLQEVVERDIDIAKRRSQGDDDDWMHK